MATFFDLQHTAKFSVIAPMALRPTHPKLRKHIVIVDIVSSVITFVCTVVSTSYFFAYISICTHPQSFPPTDLKQYLN